MYICMEKKKEKLRPQPDFCFWNENDKFVSLYGLKVSRGYHTKNVLSNFRMCICLLKVKSKGFPSSIGWECWLEVLLSTFASISKYSPTRVLVLDSNFTYIYLSVFWVNGRLDLLVMHMLGYCKFHIMMPCFSRKTKFGHPVMFRFLGKQMGEKWILDNSSSNVLSNAADSGIQFVHYRHVHKRIIITQQNTNKLIIYMYICIIYFMK